MAFEIGTATDFDDLFEKVVRFLQGYGTFTAPTYTGTGDGTMTDVDTFPATVTETWTITCTTAAPDGGTFSVTGSVSGAQANATVGTPYDNGFIKFTINDGATDFVVTDEFEIDTTAGVLPTAQRWQVLRMFRDNLLQTTTNMTEPTNTQATRRSTFHTYRYDARSLNTDQLSTADGHFYSTNYSAGVSYVQWRLRRPAEIDAIHIRAPVDSGFLTYSPVSFRLQWSDDGSSWTTAHTEVDAPDFMVGERRQFSVTGSPGVHEYWRFIIDDTQATSQVGWSELLLLDSSSEPVNYFGSEVIFKAVGNAGTDEIFTGIRAEYMPGPGWYNFFMNGYSGYDPDELSWFEQPGALPGFGAATQYVIPMVPLWDTSMPYWFAASGRSFRFGVKVSTVFEGGYLGFFLPYATPGQYPYPLAVGGSLVPQEGDSVRDEEWRYSYVDYRHGPYPMPGASTVPSSDTFFDATLYMRGNTGDWHAVANRPSSTNNDESILGPNQSLSIPFEPSGASRSVWPHCMNDQWGTGKIPYREVLGGGYIIQPCILMQRQPSQQVFGELEGTFIISGFNNAPENTAVYNSVTHVVFQGAYRNTPHEFWALSMDP